MQVLKLLKGELKINLSFFKFQMLGIFVPAMRKVTQIEVADHFKGDFTLDFYGSVPCHNNLVKKLDKYY